MIGIGLRATIVAVVLSFAALPMRPAAAADFPDQCLEGGGGMFTKQECACLDDNIEDDDRDNLVTLFKAALKAKDGGKKIDGDSPVYKKGLASLNKYENKCSKN